MTGVLNVNLTKGVTVNTLASAVNSASSSADAAEGSALAAAQSEANIDALVGLGVSGSFTTVDSKTVTVVDGIITSIV